MNLLNERVVALDNAADGALVRFLQSLGACVHRTTFEMLAIDLANADILVECEGLQQLAARGIARVNLDRHFPRLLHVSVTPFGSTGPRASWKGSELIASAMAGVLRLTGEPDRAPVKEALDACEFHAEMVAAAGVLAALYERNFSGRGQHVDISTQEVAFSRNVNSILVWQFDRRKLQRAGGALNYGRVSVRCIWKLADGYCFHSLMTGRFGAPANQALSNWMDEVGCENPLRGVDWLKYNRSTLPAETRLRWEHAIEAFFAARSRKEVRLEGRRRGINATVLASPDDVLNDTHLRSRQFWSADHAPARFVAVTPGPQPAVANRRATSSRGPLSGVRVLDFSWALVGSITTKVLGDLGCEVIKIESSTRPCLSRIDVQVSASRADSFDDKPWFAHLNSSKQSLALDMKQPSAHDVLNPLIEWADVVVENFSPGTMQKLGLDYDKLVKHNPSLIMVSGSVFGQTGPLAHEWGVDGTGAALSSRTLLSGWPDRDPAIPSAVPYGDVIVPYVMAAAVSAALTARSRTGRGCHIDASMYEICVQQMWPAIAAHLRGESRQRMGNRDYGIFHQGVYATRGDDRWVAITLRSPEEWRSLAAVARISDDDKSVEDRDAALASWFGSQTDHDIVENLQSRGFAAGIVQDIEDMMERDPQLKERGALVQLDHPLLGAFAHVRTPITFSRTPSSPYRAPRLGEHSDEIARNLSRLSAERVAALNAAGVFK